jgi:hypothetical protein
VLYLQRLLLLDLEFQDLLQAVLVVIATQQVVPLVQVVVVLEPLLVVQAELELQIQVQVLEPHLQAVAV